MSEAQLIGSIFNYVRNNGELVRQAKTSWGANTWEHENIWVSLQDDGCTERIEADSFCLDVLDNHGRIKYREGSRVNLQRLYDSIFE